MQRVLVIDDDASLLEALSGLLAHAGYKVGTAGSPEAALVAVRQEPTDLVLLDLRLGQGTGLDLLPQLKKIRPEMSVIIITGYGTIDDAVEAMRSGADNFVTKPIDPPRLLTILSKGLESQQLRRRNMQLQRVNARRGKSTGSLCPRMRQAYALADAVAPRDTTVLICGETGSGKGVLARYIHEMSNRKKQPFVELNCAGLQRDLTESELFGHERGAFTGAIERKLGLFEAADGGTLFLDEIGEMEVSIQAKLLKVMEQKRFRRVGGLTEIEADVRLIAATHRRLKEEVSDGRFREDLFYRLNVFKIEIPPLRERREDVPGLAIEFVQDMRGGAGPDSISDEAMRLLAGYDWPGNVRELRNVMERATILCPQGAIEPAHLPALDHGAAGHSRQGSARNLQEAEIELLELALKANDHNIKATARELGISRSTLYRKIERYRLVLR